MISCGIEFIDSSSGIKVDFNSYPSHRQKPLLFNQLPHPGLFIKTTNKDDLYFDENFKIAADLKQQFILFYKKGYKLKNLEIKSTIQRIGGASSGSLKKIFKNFTESREIFLEIFKKNGFIFAFFRIVKTFYRRIYRIGLFIK